MNIAVRKSALTLLVSKEYNIQYLFKYGLLPLQEIVLGKAAQETFK